MSIASAITNLTNTIRGIATTKGQIKSAVNEDFEIIDNEQIELFPDKIRTAIERYKSYIPTVNDTGKQLSLNTIPLKSKEFAVIGDTFQQTYEGKNLWGGFSNSYTGTSQTVQFTTNTDGTIIAVGTSTGSAVNGTIANLYNNGIYKTLPAGTYTISKKTADTRYQLQAYDKNATQLANTTTSLTEKSFTLTETTDVIVRVTVVSGSVMNDIIELMLEEGSTATDYEHYVGGTASPNPEYPQDIKVVTGEQIVVKRGKNLFDKNNTTIWSGYFTASGKINGKGTDSNPNKWFYIPCKPNTTYTITKPLQSTTSNNRFRVGTTSSIPAHGATLNDFWRMNDGGTDTVHSITTSSNANYLCVYYGTSYDDITDNILEVLNGLQIEEGSTATDYEPYNRVQLPLNLGTMELCKIENYQDVLFKNKHGSELYNSELEENAWYRYGGEKITLGEYDWEIAFNPSSGTRYIANSSEFQTNFDYLPICSHFKGSTDTNIGNRIAYYTQSNNLVLYTTKNIDLTEIKQWLIDNNVIAYIPKMAYTKITDTELISQLEAIDNTKMNDGTTIIYAENEEGLQPTLYVEAYTPVEEVS